MWYKVTLLLFVVLNAMGSYFIVTQDQIVEAHNCNDHESFLKITEEINSLGDDLFKRMAELESAAGPIIVERDSQQCEPTSIDNHYTHLQSLVDLYEEILQESIRAHDTNCAYYDSSYEDCDCGATEYNARIYRLFGDDFYSRDYDD